MSWKEFENEATENLIEYIQWKDKEEYLSAARDAFRAFCFKFREQVITQCRRVSHNWGYGNDVGDLIAERTFDRFWKYPKSFDPALCKKGIDTCIKLYLFRISQRLLCDYKKEISGEDFNPYTGDEQIIREFPDISSLSGSPEKLRDIKKVYEIIGKALERLTAKHRVIYLTYKAYGKDGYKLPRELLQSLRDELNLTQASIQVYKKEAFDKVNEYLSIYGSK